ncbi:MAG: quinone-interacting membrane-bound oxidoreductase complex subunit QmoC [Saprospiraceae bacterium]|nr:quinone-interacting membrane-bound oxidoreductase complex subunit QmoC [Saprospiraceae bacterium]
MNIKPNIEFIRDLRMESGADLKQCMQCGTCSVVCDLSPDDNPFPRKEMIWASWGLMDKLVSDPDVWLCHNCGDCTTYCPRDVKPGDVLAAVRSKVYEKYAKPAFLFKLLKKPIFLPITIAIPVFIIGLILFLNGTLAIPEGDVNYSKFFPHMQLNISFSTLVLIVLLGLVLSIRSFVSDIKQHLPKQKKKSFMKSLIEFKIEILLHKQFNKCQENKFRSTAHLLVLWGFILLLIVTAFAILAVVFFEYPMGLFHPVKITGNIAAAMLVIGLLIMMFQRVKGENVAGKKNYFDWLFLISLFLLTISGLLVEIARFDNWSLAYHIYFVHLVLVWMLIIYAPYTKFAHVFYRSTAIILCKMYGR